MESRLHTVAVYLIETSSSVEKRSIVQIYSLRNISDCGVRVGGQTGRLKSDLIQLQSIVRIGPYTIEFLVMCY